MSLYLDDGISISGTAVLMLDVGVSQVPAILLRLPANSAMPR